MNSGADGQRSQVFPPSGVTSRNQSKLPSQNAGSRTEASSYEPCCGVDSHKLVAHPRANHVHLGPSRNGRPLFLVAIQRSRPCPELMLLASVVRDGSSSHP